MERLLLQKLYSPAARGFSYFIGYKSLVDALKLYEDRPKYQRLVIDFERGEDPDDAYSRIPYEKGSDFLLHLGKCSSYSTELTNVTGYAQNVCLVALTSFCHTSTTTSPRTWERASPLSSGKNICIRSTAKNGTPKHIEALDSVKWNVSWHHTPLLQALNIVSPCLGMAVRGRNLAAGRDDL